MAYYLFNYVNRDAANGPAPHKQAAGFLRISDGAKLILPAQASGDGTFIAESEGIRYTVTAKSLSIGDGTKVVREEPMVDFHGPPAPAAPSPSSTTPTSSTPTSTTALPPPLPAEQGHAS